MNHIIIRDFKENDMDGSLNLYKEVSNIHSENRSDIYKKSTENLDEIYFLKIAQTENILITIAELNSEIVGLCISEIKITKNNPLLHDKKVLYINTIVVSSNHKRKGIGKKLYNGILEKAKSLNIDKIELVVWDFNTSAISFYQKLGFKIKYNVMEKEI